MSTITPIKPTPKQIEEALRPTPNFAYWGDLPAEGRPVPEGRKPWTLGPCIEHRDSPCLDRVNAKAIRALFEEKFGPESTEPDGSDGRWQANTYRHWAVGQVTQLAFEVDDSEDGPFALWLGICRAIENYPCLDDDALSELEEEEGRRATLEAIRHTARNAVADDAPEDWADKVLDWLWENNYDAVEVMGNPEDGCDPKEADIVEALRALDWLDPSYVVPG